MIDYDEFKLRLDFDKNILWNGRKYGTIDNKVVYTQDGTMYESCHSAQALFILYCTYPDEFTFGDDSLSKWVKYIGEQLSSRCYR